MRDGRTRKIAGSAQTGTTADTLAHMMLSLVVVSGRGRGDEIRIREERFVVGRGPGVSAIVPDTAMSRQHFVLEVTGTEVRIRDLASTNGILLNGKPVETAELSHGDRISAGEHVFQFLAEPLESQPRTYVVSE